MRESVIEKKVCEYAKRNGWIVRKFTSPAQRQAPTRIFLRKGLIRFAEFKAPGKKPTKAQLFEHQKYFEQGFYVHVIDDIEKGKEILT